MLDEIIEFILNPDTRPDKISAILEIIHDSKNIIMNLLEERQFAAIEKLISIPQIFLNSQKILLHKDREGKNIINYFIEYASQQLIKHFFQLLKNNCENSSIRIILQDKFHQANHLMYITSKQDSDLLFKDFADIIIMSLGTEALYKMLSDVNGEGNNCLMLAFQHRNLQIVKKIFDILDQTIKDNENKQKIENTLFSQIDLQGRNILMLVAATNDELLNDTYKLIMERLKGIAITPLFQRDSEKNDIFILSLISDNEFIIKQSIHILDSLQEKQKNIALQMVFSGFNASNNHFITIAINKHKIDIYLEFIKIVEESLDQNLIISIFKRIFDVDNDFLKNVFSSNNINVIMSIMKYIELTNDSIGYKNKEYVAELILKKDVDNNSLLLTSTQSQNFEVCKIILDIANDSLNKIDLIRLLNSRGSDNMTCYMTAKSQRNENIATLIKNFAEKTDNLNYITLQEIEIKNMLTAEQSHHYLLSNEIRI